MTVVLDTHAWLWSVAEPERLSGPARRVIAEAETVIVATISCREVAMLALKGRIELDREPPRWIRQALALPGVLAHPPSPQAAVEAALISAEQGFPR